MKKLLLASAAWLCASFANAQNCSDLFISKYVSMGASNKCLEIYNPTPNPIVLNGKYYIARYKTPTSSGNTSGPVPSPPSFDDTLWLKGTVHSYSTWVICNPETTPNNSNFGAICNPTLQAHANQLGNIYGTYGSSVGDPTYFKGSDAITIEKKVGASVTIVDIFGRFTDYMASTTGKPSAWSTVAPYTGGAGMGWWLTKGYMLVRKPSVKTGVTTNPSAFITLTEYDTIAKPKNLADTINTWNKLGSHTCDCNASGIREYPAAADIKIYPNPVGDQNDVIYVRTSVFVSSISLFSIDGKLISAKTVIGRNNITEVSGLKNLEKGVYVLKLTFIDGSRGTTRFVRE